MDSISIIAENVTYIDSFGSEHISKEIRKFNGNKNDKNKYLENTSTWFNDFMLKGKSRLETTNLVSSNECE